MAHAIGIDSNVSIVAIVASAQQDHILTMSRGVVYPSARPAVRLFNKNIWRLSSDFTDSSGRQTENHTA